MKQILIIAIFLTANAITNAQTVIYSEDFESFTTNSGLADQSTYWNTRTQPYTAIEDPIVIDSLAASGSKSVYITSNQDIFYDFDSLTSGTIRISYKMYVTSGKFSSIGFQHTSTEGAFACLMGMGSIAWVEGVEPTSPGGPSPTPVAAYTQGTWVTFDFDIDLDSDLYTISADGNQIAGPAQFSLVISQGASINTTLENLRIYGISGGGAEAGYAIDDFVVTTGIPSIVTSIESPISEIDINLYPNPTSGSFVVDGNDLDRIEIYTIDGQLVMQKALNASTATIDLQEFTNGIYIAKIWKDDKSVTKKISLIH